MGNGIRSQSKRTMYAAGSKAREPDPSKPIETETSDAVLGPTEFCFSMMALNFSITRLAFPAMPTFLGFGMARYILFNVESV